MAMVQTHKTQRRESIELQIFSFLRSHLDWQKAFWYNDGKTTTTITAGAKSVRVCVRAGSSSSGQKEDDSAKIVVCAAGGSAFLRAEISVSFN
jgi:hypothetical protein